MLHQIHAFTIPAAYALLSPQMNRPAATAMLLARNANISGAAKRLPRSTTPHHTPAIGGRVYMADPNPIIHPRLKFVTSGSVSVCPNCLQPRFVNDQRRIGKRCFACAMSAKATKYQHACPDCGEVALLNRCHSRERCRSCAVRARNTTHGRSNHPLYRVLKSAEARCKYEATKDYKWYGGRGISVCEEWKNNPGVFVEWGLANGWKPGLDLDRRDNDGPYAPDNCRFVTHQVNCQNKRNSR